MHYDVLDELANEDLLDLEFTFTKLPSINDMDITSTVLPVSQVYRNPVVSRLIQDHSREYEEIEVTLSSAMNSSSFQRRNVKAGVKGDSHSQPLLPGGFTLLNSFQNEQSEDQNNTTERELCSEAVLQLLNQTVVPSSLPCTFLSFLFFPLFSHSHIDTLESETTVDGIFPSFASDPIPSLTVQKLTSDLDEFASDYQLPATYRQESSLQTLFTDSLSFVNPEDLSMMANHIRFVESTSSSTPISVTNSVTNSATDSASSSVPVNGSLSVSSLIAPSREAQKQALASKRATAVHVADLPEEALQRRARECLAIKVKDDDFVTNVSNRGVKLSSGNRAWGIKDNSDMSNFRQLVPHLAQEFSFELDDFQKRSIVHLERGEDVYVCAHTSAGKTVVADYAISLCEQHQTKLIYTSPVKALSNQKYYDFRQKYSNVGVITGDVSINPEANTLIMTTEILQMMLYNGSDIIRDVEWVVFDEAHYLNDADRGVVWEETIILMPEHIKMIFLSATTPNVEEIADWIGRTKKRRVYIMETPHRPVPLEYRLLYNNKTTTVGEREVENDK